MSRDALNNLDEFDDDDFDAAFEAIVEADEALDGLLEMLESIGLHVEPWQRGIVASWSCGVGDSALPTGVKVELLKRRLLWPRR